MACDGPMDEWMRQPCGWDENSDHNQKYKRKENDWNDQKINYDLEITINNRMQTIWKETKM